MKNKEKIQFNPVLSKTKNNDGDDFKKWYGEKFLKTSFQVRLGIGGETAEQEVKNICEKFGISDWQKVGYTARIFRDIFCDKIKEEEVRKRAIEEIGIKKEDLEVFMSLVNNAKQKIAEAGKKEYDELIDKLTLKEAVRKYPEVQDQSISEEALRIEENDYLVAGTVKNWLKNYFQIAGGNKHNSLERSDYLFKSEKIKALSQEEKDRLNVILRAFDEDCLIAVNKEEKQIDFNESRYLNEGNEELNGVMKSYDANLAENFNQGGLNKDKIKKEKSFRKIESTPSFEVDRIENRNTVNLERSSSATEKKEKEKKGVNKKNQNILDLSEYL